MYLVGFIIRIFHDARSSECQIETYVDDDDDDDDDNNNNNNNAL